MIVRHIHQTWKDAAPPPALFPGHWIRSWKELNPGWGYTLWTDDDISSFVEREYPSFLPVWRAYDSQIKRVDAWRYLVLKSLGGLYVDLDFVCLTPLDDWLPVEPLLCGGDQGDGIFCNAFLWAPQPRLPAFEGIEEALRASAHEPNVIRATGPHFLDHYVSLRRGLATLLPSGELYPLAWNEKLRCAAEGRMSREELASRHPRSKAITFWSASWVESRLPPSKQAEAEPRILIGMCSCEANAGRRDACRETWLSDLPPSVSALFFVGGKEEGLQGDTVVVEAPDSYNYLPLKVRLFFRYAIDHYEFDWLFKCDDDTYLSPQRLVAILPPDFDLIGNEFLIMRGSPSGGAGYGISRRYVEMLARDGSLPQEGDEDVIIGRAVIQMGARHQISRLLRYDFSSHPSVNNGLVSSHGYSPAGLRMIHRLYSQRIQESIVVTHPYWEDIILLYEGGLFLRQSSYCTGNWHRDSQGLLHLNWFQWGEEIFRPRLPAGSGPAGRSGSHAYILIPKVERTLYVELAGGLGNQMFQYAYGLALSRKLEASLKLTHDSRGRPFALGIFGLKLDELPSRDSIRLQYPSSFSPDLIWPLLPEIHTSTASEYVISGYFQNERYFQSVAEEVRSRFFLASGNGPHSPANLVGVHVRRGDFVKSRQHDLCRVDYFVSAMALMRQRLSGATFRVFSDDPAWCEEQFTGISDVEISREAGLRETFGALQRCKAFILSNSTFGWWAAWLADAKLVIAPNRFLADQEWEICPSRWITLPPEGV